ncbi:MAG: FAD-binding protein, partial [Planctomycetia bacterium]|nr:FAD-binding protein [Planctomycetia bacterium]
SYANSETSSSSPVTGTVYGAVFYERASCQKNCEAETSEISEKSQNNLENPWKMVEIHAENVIFAVGGPGGLYRTSVYPKVHHGAIGVALAAGAVAQNLPESQFGLASICFRWNVSGTYMQCIPRFVSTAADGVSDEKEFLEEYGQEPGEVLPLVFLKGYQWPFDSRKTWLPTGVVGHWGSSMIDIWVYTETVLRGRRVWLDFTRDPVGISPEKLGGEAWNYLKNSGASELKTPLARLEKMNPAAIEMYADHGINIRTKKLEIAVCAQHNNGGLATDVNWESVNLRHLFPVGEVNGSHGVYRPGGSALNSGQVGAIRAAREIALRFRSEKETKNTKNTENLTENIPVPVEECVENWLPDRQELQARMTEAGGFLRREKTVIAALADVRKQREKYVSARMENGTEADSGTEVRMIPSMETDRNGSLLLAEEIYLDAIRFQLESGVGSRGSAITLTDETDNVNYAKNIDHTKNTDHLEKVAESSPRISLNGQEVRIVPENEAFRKFVQESWFIPPTGKIGHRWVERREIPSPDSWFENVWRQSRKAD